MILYQEGKQTIMRKIDQQIMNKKDKYKSWKKRKSRLKNTAEKETLNILKDKFVIPQITKLEII